MTPLHLAAKAGHVNTVRCLVEQGADINIRGHNCGVSEWEYTADCKLILQIRICSHSPNEVLLLEKYGNLASQI